MFHSRSNSRRFMVDDNRAIFMFRDGSQAWEAKNFLIEQDRCESVTIENKVYPGKSANSKVSSFSLSLISFMKLCVCVKLICTVC